MITDINQLDLNKKYTYADYLTWQFEDMVELIRGKIFKMSPAPGTTHQAISMNLSLIIANYLKGKPCSVFAAPFDVILPLPPAQQTTDKIDTVVQPDICVICDPAKIDERGCKGAPDWIIEILSKSTAQKDIKEKYELYENAGVKEYWIVSPVDQHVLAYTLDDNGQYQSIRTQAYVKGEKLEVSVIEGLVVDFEEVFEE
jgi:Uma2 family endonuclease